MPKRRLYFQSLKGTCDNVTADYVKGKRVGKYKTLYVTAGALEDETHAPTTISFGKLIGTRFEPMEEMENPSVGVRYHLDKTHRFDPGDRPTWRVEGGTLNDVFSGYLEGYIEEEK